MTHSANVPKNAVQVREIEYEMLLEMARGGPEEPYPLYTWGVNQKIIWSNFQDPDAGIYGKPVSVSNGVTTHLPDPDLISTNP